MSQHVSPERWADLAAGRVAASDAARLIAHAAACRECGAARARVETARNALRDISAAEPPPLPWERIGAHVHWTVSREMRRVEPSRGNLWRWLAASVAAAAAIGLAWSFLGGLPTRAPREASTPVVAPAPPAPVVAPAPVRAPTALSGVVTLLAGQVALDGAPLAADAVILPGQRLTTGEGRVHVQFGADSVFQLEPRSVLELARFDDHEVELRVEGAVGVVIAHREPDQRFQVVAGGRRVEVRGTVFRVASGPTGLAVAVTRGRVAVLDGAASVDVPAGSWLEAPLGVGLAGLTARPLNDEESRLAAEQLALHAMAVWPGAEAARSTSALLRLSAPSNTPVRVDGVGIGRGDVVARVTAGRHLVAIGTREEWLDAAAGAVVVPTPAPSKHVSERAAQVEGQLSRHRARLEGCAENARRVTPDFGGELVVEIEIDADGSLHSAGALRGLPDRDAEECILSVIREQFTFPAGSRDLVRKSIRF